MANSMQRVLTAAQMQQCDVQAMRSFRISGHQLMEAAGKGIAEVLRRDFIPLAGKNILVACGKGNNGGDGFVIARHCAGMGASVIVVLAEPPSKRSPEAFANYQILVRLQKDRSNGVRTIPFSRAAMKTIGRPDVIIDALLGTGFSGTLRKPYLSIIEWMNGLGAPIVSVDVPSGMNGTSGVAGAHVRAKRTLTRGALKTGLLMNEGMEDAGTLEIVDIGLPRSLIERKDIQTFRVSAESVAGLLPSRSVGANKYSVGKLFILAGSKRYTGAAALCAQSGLRSGTGAVLLAVPKSIQHILARKLTEPVLLPLEESEEGTVSPQALKEILTKIDWSDAAVIGPGLSQNAQTYEVVEAIIRRAAKPLVLDADALNALQSIGLSVLKKSQAKIVITPHTGEFSRLTKLSSKTIEENRIEAARAFASDYGVTVILKGSPTVTAHSDGRVVINASGNPGMATVGSGDVLAGLLGGFIAQRMNCFDAAFCTAYLHGLAGDCAAEEFGQPSLLASDILGSIPQAFSRIKGFR